MPRNAWKRHGVRDEQGTILVVTVVAMLILGILAISFAALGDLEVRIGMNDVWDKQAALVAEGGISAVRNQIQTPPDYTAFLDGRVYSCTTSACSCSTGCATARLATMTTGEFSVRIDNDPDDPSASPTVDGNKRVILTALGITRGATGNVMGRSRIRAWLTNDDPWDHVCGSGDGVLCTDTPPNNSNATVTPSDPNDQNGPRSYPEIPRPSDIRCTPSVGGALGLGAGSPYPVPSGLTNAQVPAAPRGPCVMYPYYEIALTTACAVCNPPTSAYDPITCPSGDACLGMVRFDADLDIRNGSSNTNRLGVSGNTLASQLTPSVLPATLYVTGKVRAQSQIGTILGSIILHGGGDPGSGGSQTDFALAGPHTLTTQGPGCLPNCAYPFAVLAYNPNEPIPPGQTIYLDISNSGVVITGTVYTGGTVDFGPNTINGSILGYTVHANNAATQFTYSPAYENYLPPTGFTTPSVTLPSVVARGTWIQCRTADNLTDPCD
jgi:Tfp pilus assembly protein PilX